MNKEDIRRLIAQERIEDAMEALQQLGNQEVLLLLARYRQSKKQLNLGLISFDEFQRVQLQIVAALLGLLSATAGSAPPRDKGVEETDESEFESFRGPSESVPPPPKDAAPGDQEAASPSNRIVNTGFAENETPAAPLTPDRTLAIGRKYFFWLEVGEIMEHSIETRPTALPTERLPEEAELDVALYSLNDAFSIDAGADVGKLKLTKNDTVEVLRQPQQPFQVQVAAEMAKKRLFFPLQAAPQEGKGLLKCNIYCRGIMVQSREIRAEIRSQAQPLTGALASDLRYSLSYTLTAEQLNRTREHKLSVLLSEGDADSHSFQIFGGKQFKNDASFGEGEIADALTQIRGALRYAAWGTENEHKDEPYRYEQKSANLAQLSGDLYMLAKRGYRLYKALVNRFAGGGRSQVAELEKLMLEPGFIQLVLQKGAKQVLPLACLYDYPLDDGVPSSDYSLCSQFKGALENKQALTECACFQGRCPSRGNPLVICPSGFWGYRHYLGMPQSVKNSPFAPAEIFYTDKPAFAMSVWKKDDFKYREQHVKKLRDSSRIAWKYADDRDTASTMLQDKQIQLVYFYCHGGVSGTTPYLLVGDNKSYIITPTFFDLNNIFWEDAHPLVFINGCHTTELSPEKALDFVSVFVENALCAGVIGTEITIFEPLAVAFSEAFIERFSQGATVGQAIRDTRLDILQQGNPLGLVYIPYVMSGLQLVKKAS